VFTHGTIIMHAAGAGRPREEVVRQVRDGTAPSLRDFAGYIPVGHAPEKVRQWAVQGAEIVYLTPHRVAEDVEADRKALHRHGFPLGQILFRAEGADYAETVRRARPDVLVEDDCESIGGSREMVSPHLDPNERARIRVFVVPEFGGIDHLPGSVRELMGRETDGSST
jgi:hypothetical protein